MRLHTWVTGLLCACSAFAGTIYVSTDVPKSILDNAAVASSIFVPDSFTVTDVNVRVNITHTFDADLIIALWGPPEGIGPYVYLAYLVGGAGDNFADTVFDDGAATPIESGTAPFTGSFRPRANSFLSAYNGREAQGTWTLTVADTATGDTGVLAGWSLEFNGGAQTPEPGVWLTVLAGVALFGLRRRPNRA